MNEAFDSFGLDKLALALAMKLCLLGLQYVSFSIQLDLTNLPGSVLKMLKGTLLVLSYIMVRIYLAV